jgi:hypothetical protein
MINRFEFAPWLVHLCSVANLGVFGWLLADYFGVRFGSATWFEPSRTLVVAKAAPEKAARG